jgi:hypothetical protein
MADRYGKKAGFLLHSVVPVVLLLCTAVIIFGSFRIEPSDARCDRLIYPWSPALNIIRYHWETFENHQFSIKTPYFGFEPTDQLEDVWNELLPSTQHELFCIPSRLLFSRKD